MHHSWGTPHALAGDPRAEEKDKTEHGMERWAQDHDEEPKYARLEWWGACIEIAVPILEDVPSAVLNMCIVARHGIGGGQLTVLVITLMNLTFKARRLRKAFKHLLTISAVFSKESIPSRVAYGLNKEILFSLRALWACIQTERGNFESSSSSSRTATSSRRPGPRSGSSSASARSSRMPISAATRRSSRRKG